MKYLVLQDFRSFGKPLTRGSVVDESEIRSPLLRQSEGKITPAVSSFTAPPVPETETTDTGEQTLGDDDTSVDEPTDTVETTPTTGKKQSFRLSK